MGYDVAINGRFVTGFPIPPFVGQQIIINGDKATIEAVTVDTDARTILCDAKAQSEPTPKAVSAPTGKRKRGRPKKNHTSGHSQG